MKIFKKISKHKRKIRIGFWSLFILLTILIFLPMFFFFYLFNENQVKKMIIDQFDNNNYHISIQGSVRPKFWHGLSLEINDLEVATKLDKELLHINSMNCQLSWVELVIGTYRVKRVSLKGLDIDENNILDYGIKNLFNVTNLHYSEFAWLKALEVFDIRTIGNKQTYKISSGSLKVLKNSGGIASFSLGFKLDNQNMYVSTEGSIYSIEDNVINFDEFSATIFNQRNTKVVTSSKARLFLNDKILLLNKAKGNFSFPDYSGTLEVDEIKLSLNGADVQNVKINMNFGNEFLNQAFIMNVSHLSVPEFNQMIIDQLQLQYSADIGKNNIKINSFLAGINIDEKMHITSQSCINKINFSTSTLKNLGINAMLDGVCEYVADKNLLNLHLAGNLYNAPLKLDLKIYNSDKKPYIIISGYMQDLDLSRVQVNKQKLLPFYYDEGKLPFSWLSLINMDANLNIKHFALDRINLNNVSTKFTIANDELKINKINADVYYGLITASGKIVKTADGYNISSIQSIKNLELQKMFEDLFDVKAISGKANLNMSMFANNIYSYNDIYKKLNAQIMINANHGVFRGVDFNLFVNPQGISLSSEKSTVFDQLEAKFNFSNGISKSGILSFSSPYVIANGGGEIDFKNSKLDYKLMIKSALPQNTQKINSVLIPVVATGNLFSPAINIQNIHLYSTPVKSKNNHSHKGKKRNKR